ncbi:alpha/beta hydrolase [soil metagenome]
MSRSRCVSSESLGLRLLSYARPGYSGSSRQPGRSIADAAADTAAVVDAIGASDFVTVGHSGGGPHALACAALLPDRCRAAVTLGGVAPHDAAGIDWMAGMADENAEEFTTALDGEAVLRPYLTRYVQQFADVTAEDVAASLAGLVSDVDRAALTADLADMMARSLQRAAVDGVDGWIDDDLAFTKPWGFDVAAIAVPVAVWQGRHDRMVPFDHGQWLIDHIPTARSRLLDDEGHISLRPRRAPPSRPRRRCSRVEDHHRTLVGAPTQHVQLSILHPNDRFRECTHVIQPPPTVGRVRHE